MTSGFIVELDKDGRRQFRYDGRRVYRMVEIGETITDGSAYLVKSYEGVIATPLVNDNTLRELGLILNESPTGCVFFRHHLGSSYGGTYYFRTKELLRQWYDAITTAKTTDYPDATSRSGAVQAAT